MVSRMVHYPAAILVLIRTHITLSLRFSVSENCVFDHIRERRGRMLAAGRPSGFLTRCCDVNFYPIELAFVPFGETTIKLQVIKFSKMSIYFFIYFKTFFQKGFDLFGTKPFTNKKGIKHKH